MLSRLRRRIGSSSPVIGRASTSKPPARRSATRGVRRAALAGPRLPEVCLSRPGPAKRAAAGSLARYRRSGALSRILCGARQKITTLLSSLRASDGRGRAKGRRSDPPMPKRLMIVLCVAALAVAACHSNTSTTPTPSFTPGSLAAEPEDYVCARLGHDQRSSPETRIFRSRSQRRDRRRVLAPGHRFKR